MNTLFFFMLLTTLNSQANLRYEKNVLKDVLFRAGGSGGTNDLDLKTIRSLCERGFKKVYYLYPDKNFRNEGEHQCEYNGSTNTLDYLGGGFTSKTVKPILLEVAKSAEGQGGPVLAHCWNGWHASGEVAALALMQFCDWPGENAAKYWADNIQDKGNLPKYGSILKRIKGFKPFTDIRISEDAKARVCP